MTAKEYSAGTIFLQVVPVFDDVIKSIGRQSKDINRALGDEMEKGGRDAGERAGKAMGESLETEAKKSGEKASKAYAGSFEERIKSAVAGAQREMDALSLKGFDADAEKYVGRVHKKLSDLKDIDYTGDFDAKKVMNQIGLVEAYMEKIAKEEHRLNITDNTLKIRRNLGALRDEAEKVAKEQHTLRFGADFKQAERAMGTFEKKFRATAKAAAESLGDSMRPEIAKVKKELDTLAANVEVDFDSEKMMLELKRLQAELAKVSREQIDIGSQIDIASSMTKIGILTKAVSSLDGRRINIKADVDTGSAVAHLGMLNKLLAAFRPRATGASSASESAANSFRAFNFIILGAVTLLPALIPLIGALGGGLLALLPILGSVGAGLGVALLGFSGLSDAVTAMGKVQDNAGKDALAASKTMRSAANGVRDAQRGVADATRSAAQANADAQRQVADARRSAAEAIQSALEQQKAAADDYQQSVKDVQQAEADLRQARKDAAAEIAQHADDRKQNALDERQGLIDVFNAQVAYNAVMADGSSTNLDKEQAAIALKQAQLHLKETRDTEKDLAAQRKKDRKDGVNGTQTVQTAQDQLTQALQAQADAQKAVGDAAAAVTKARIDGARSVADAVRSQQRTEADGQRSIANAQRALKDAQVGYKDAVEQTGEVGSASMHNLEVAMGKLSPAGRKFARFLFSLRDDFHALRDGVQEAMLPGVQRGLETIINTYGPQFADFTKRMGASLGTLFDKAGQGLGSEPWRNFFSTYSKIAPGLMEDFAKSTGNWMTVFVRLFTIVAPYAERFSDAMLALSERALDFMNTKAGADYWTKFMDYAAKVGPDVARFFGNLALAIINIARSLAPYGAIVLHVVDGLLAFIAGLDPKVLRQAVVGIIAVVIAMQAAVGVSSLVLAGASIFATAAGTFVFGFVLVAAAAVTAYQKFETFRNIVDSLAHFINDHREGLIKLVGVVAAIGAAYKIYSAITKTVAAVQVGLTAAQYGTGYALKEGTLASKVYSAAMAKQRAMSLLTAAATWVQTTALWANTVAWLANPVVLIILAIIAVVALFIGALVLLYRKNETFRHIVDAAWNALKETAQIVFRAVMDAISAAWDFIEPIFQAIGDAATWLWEKAFKPAFHFIVKGVQQAFKFFKTMWTHILWPVLDLIMTVVWKLWKFYFKVVFTLIKAGFKVLVWALRGLWNNVLKPVFDAIKKVVLWLWDHVFQPVWHKIKDGFEVMARGLKEAWDRWGAPLFKSIREVVLPRLKTAFENVVDGIGKIWDGLKKLVGTPIKFIIETVINNGIVKGFNKIANFVGSDPMTPIEVPSMLQNLHTGGIFGRHRDMAYAGGGVMPGYTPGQDVHHFTSPTGGRLNLSGGEAVMRPEFTAAMGPAWIDHMNAVARAEGARGVRRLLGQGAFSQESFAKGGVLNPDEKVYMDGKAIARIAAAQITLAKKKFGMSMYLMQGGFGGDHIAASGSSHNYPGVADVGVGSIPMETALRKVGFAAWARNVAGRASVGSGAHVHAASLLSPGTQASPQIYGSWPAHKDGLSGGPGSDPAPHPSWIPNLAKLLGPIAEAGVFTGGGAPQPQHKLPGWAEKIIGKPIDWAKGLMAQPVDAFKQKFGDNGLVDALSGIPVKLIKGLARKVIDIIPGKAAFNAAGDLIDQGVHQAGDIAHSIGGTISDGAGALGEALGFYRGGILPHNGTMMYDQGGYLPPGLTTVVNMTGKPEPVFTNDQWGKMNGGTGADGFHYEPHFHQSDLTAADVADDLDFEIRKQRRKGKYGKQG